MLPNHLLVSSGDGALYDTRQPQWAARPPLRATYDRHCRDIKTVAEFKATLRAGAFAWPGGYPLYFICDDGESLSFKSARENLREIYSAISDGRRGDGWRVVACDINYESELYCAHSGDAIESAYGVAESANG